MVFLHNDSSFKEITFTLPSLSPFLSLSFSLGIWRPRHRLTLNWIQVARPAHEHLYRLNHLTAPPTIFGFDEPPIIEEVYIQVDPETWNPESRYEHPGLVGLLSGLLRCGGELHITEGDMVSRTQTSKGTHSPRITIDLVGKPKFLDRNGLYS